MVSRVLFVFVVLRFAFADQTIDVRFINSGTKNGVLSWVNEGNKVKVGDVIPGGTLEQNTYTGHRFEFDVAGLDGKTVNVQSTGAIVFIYNDKAVSASGDALKYKVQTNNYIGEKWDNITEKVRDRCNTVWSDHTADRQYFCAKRFDERVFVRSKFDYDDVAYERMMKPKHMQRIRGTATQPQHLYNFTNVGFKELDIPADLLTDLTDFHKKGRITRAHPESMPFDDPYLSGRDSDTWISDLPGDLQSRVYSHVKSEIAKWVAVQEEELLKTAVFGIRLYHQGSVLNMHCDRRDTHVLSAILQIGRANEQDTAPWDLHILDHAGKEHRVPARAGQLILYESATCSHGRPDVFPGLEMANAFCHFHLKGWPSKYEAHLSKSKEL